MSGSYIKSCKQAVFEKKIRAVRLIAFRPYPFFCQSLIRSLLLVKLDKSQQVLVTGNSRLLGFAEELLRTIGE